MLISIRNFTLNGKLFQVAVYQAQGIFFIYSFSNFTTLTKNNPKEWTSTGYLLFDIIG